MTSLERRENRNDTLQTRTCRKRAAVDVFAFYCLAEKGQAAGFSHTVVFGTENRKEFHLGAPLCQHIVQRFCCFAP
eukprot:scaffold1184_cov132-Cylindrotheca_fusiformis.AAC.53